MVKHDVNKEKYLYVNKVVVCTMHILIIISTRNLSFRDDLFSSQTVSFNTAIIKKRFIINHVSLSKFSNQHIIFVTDLVSILLSALNCHLPVLVTSGLQKRMGTTWQNLATCRTRNGNERLNNGRNFFYIWPIQDSFFSRTNWPVKPNLFDFY